MTEEEWLHGTDPEPMLEFLRGKASDRKLRLFACACCRRSRSIVEAEWKNMVTDGRAGVEVQWPKEHADLLGRAVHLGERVADGLADLAEMESLFSSPDEADEMRGCYADGADAAWAAKACAYQARWNANYLSPATYRRRARLRYHVPCQTDHDREHVLQSHLLRDIFGNPFRPVAVDPIWLTERVVELARSIYDERAFDRLAVLAQTLAAAGCNDEGLLSHCRAAVALPPTAEPQRRRWWPWGRQTVIAPGETTAHVRGCWAVDLILGKE
jgi:hypothetical protein